MTKIIKRRKKNLSEIEFPVSQPFKVGQVVKNIWEKSDIYGKIGKVVEVRKENNKISEVVVEFKKDGKKIRRFYTPRFNLDYIIPLKDENYGSSFKE